MDLPKPKRPRLLTVAGLAIVAVVLSSAFLIYPQVAAAVGSAASVVAAVTALYVRTPVRQEGEDPQRRPTAEDRRVPPPTEPPRPPRRVVAPHKAHMAGVVVAAGCFIAANFLPIGSAYFTDKSSGLQTAQVTLTFNLGHPWTRQIATGPDSAKVHVTQWLAPFLGIGTAAMLALAVLFPLLLRSADPDLKAMGKSMYTASLIWVSVFALFLVIAQATNLIKLPDASGLYERDVPQSGAWMLFAASVMVSETLRRTERRLRQPSATQAS